MAITIGQPGSVKNILSKINVHGFSQINSLKDIEDFLKTYTSKKSEIHKFVEDKVDRELKTLKNDINSHRIVLSDNNRIKKDFLINRINKLANKLDRLANLELQTKLARFIVNSRINILRIRIYILKRNSVSKIHRSTKALKKKVILFEIKYNYLLENKNRIVEKRVALEIKELENLKTLLESKSSLISGAVGEQLVAKELDKLPDEFIVLNDFNARFESPIFIKTTNDHVLSVQIDHIVLSKAGIFLIETKNWSKKSVQSIDLRSPVEQIVRNGRALFVKIQTAINKGNIHLVKHHWGQKKIPIRNLIVMTNNKPSGEFEFVKIKLLRELNGYLQYFDHVLSNEELESLKDFLVGLQKQ